MYHLLLLFFIQLYAFKKVKVKFSSYIVQYPILRIAQSAFHFQDRPVQPDTISTSLGSIQPYATINARRLLVHISTTVNSQVFIQLSEMEQGRLKIVAKVLTPQHRIRTRVLLVESPKLYP